MENCFLNKFLCCYFPAEKHAKATTVQDWYGNLKLCSFDELAFIKLQNSTLKKQSQH